MKQVLTDLYKVSFNKPTRLHPGGPLVVTHETNPEDYIELNQTDPTIVIGEPYLLPLSKYGGGFRTKNMIGKKCCWVGSAVASKLADKNAVVQRSRGYRMVEEP